MLLSYVSKRFSRNIMFVILFLLLFGRNAAGIKCYVCGEDDDSSCDKFFLNKNLYAKDCPRNSQACSTIRTKETLESMGCESEKIDDCQLGNGQEYCYCSTDLCNGNESIKKSITSSSTYVNDDEDFEGSGYNQAFSTVDTSLSMKPTTVQPQNTADCLRSTFIVIAASILFP